MARESYTSTLGREPIPNLGVNTDGAWPPSPLHHEAKEQVQFWSTPRYAFTTYDAVWHGVSRTRRVLRELGECVRTLVSTTNLDFLHRVSHLDLRNHKAIVETVTKEVFPGGERYWNKHLKGGWVGLNGGDL